jgi:hypothetical protein
VRRPGDRTPGRDRGRRHGDDAQVVAQRRLRLAHQGEGEVGLEPRSCNSSKITQPMPSSDGSSCSIRRNSPSVTTSMRCARSHLGVEPHAVADGLADMLAQSRRHAPRRGARRQPSRLLHDDLAAAQPRRIEQRQRHARRLAGAGGATSTADQVARPAPLQERRQASSTGGKSMAGLLS